MTLSKQLLEQLEKNDRNLVSLNLGNQKSTNLLAIFGEKNNSKIIPNAVDSDEDVALLVDALKTNTYLKELTIHMEFNLKEEQEKYRKIFQEQDQLWQEAASQKFTNKDGLIDAIKKSIMNL